MKRKLWFGVSMRTDVFEVALCDPRTGDPWNDPIGTRTLSIALREGLARVLGIETRELGVVVRNLRLENDPREHRVIALFDQAVGGAGYASSAGARLRQVMEQANTVLDCPERCESACHACVLTYDTQGHVRELDRHVAQKFLKLVLEGGFTMPEEYRLFGAASQPEQGDLRHALLRGIQRESADRIRIHLTGDALQWDLDAEAWPLWSDLLRMRGEGRAVELCLTASDCGRLDKAQASRLAGAAEGAGIRLRLLDGPARFGDGFVLAELGAAGRSVRWASRAPVIGTPGPRWGSAAHASVVVREDVGSPIQDVGKVLEVSSLRPEPKPGVVHISVLGQLDGKASKFGEGLWNLIMRHAPEVMGTLQGGKVRPVKLAYVDRYLRSPTSIRLLHETVKRLLQICAARPEGRVPMEVKTAYLEQGMRSLHLDFDHDWESEDSRRTVIENVMRSVDVEAKLQRSSTAKLPHARTLDIDWSDGRVLTIALDQGFGSWRCRTETKFPFAEGDQSQCVRLLGSDFDLAMRSIHPVPLYVHPFRGPDQGKEARS